MDNIFQITGWDETPYSENDDGSKKSHAKITQSYSGVIEGSSEVHYLMSYQSAASALFVGFEVITASVNGKFEKGIASSAFIIVAGSGTNELVNIEGFGSFTSGESGRSSYTLTLNTEY